MAKHRKKLGILLVPAHGRMEFKHLPVPYFWLSSLTIDKNKIEVIAFDVKNKDEIAVILNHEIDSLLMTGKSVFVEGKLNTFNYCLNAITNDEAICGDWLMTQQLKKSGIYTYPEEVFFLPTTKKNQKV